MALNASERRLLSFPPTPQTWICGKKRRIEEVLVECGTVNSGSTSDCWNCGASKPRTPALLWPAYLRACTKAKHTPGERWPAKVVTDSAPAPKTRRKSSRA